MNLNQAFEKLALIDMSWVVWVLVMMSVLSVAIMIERSIFFFRFAKVRHEDILAKLTSILASRKYAEGAEELAKMRQTAPQVLSAGLAQVQYGPGAAEEAMLGVMVRERLFLERFLVFLGTVSNNAPFLGLFGTVTGLIKSFYQLGASGTPDMKVVMFGVTEALVTTALGLIVAIPAVMANNAFRRQARGIMTRTEELARLLLTHARRNDFVAIPKETEAKK
ncbi:MotA/TolQ/ExbB proton channel family protein [Myxococcota bacterium]|nr:MotA/TolQ/ExbB proton channel family protein [Myxococcota bacterium]